MDSEFRPPTPDHGQPADHATEAAATPAHRAPRGLVGLFGRPVWLEARSPFEVRALRRSRFWRGDGIPPGRGRPLLIFPGFLASRRSTAALHHVMRAAGWRAHVAPVGRNAGPAQHSVDAATGLLHHLHEETGERVRIIGHSRGGQFGRILAVKHPEFVSQVIAIGTPLTVKYPDFVVVKLPAETLDTLWRRGAFGHVDIDREQAVDDLRYVPFPADVDLVSIWSRTDGIVDWRLSQELGAADIEVDASHLGLMNSIPGMEAISEALARLP